VPETAVITSVNPGTPLSSATPSCNTFQYLASPDVTGDKEGGTLFCAHPKVETIRVAAISPIDAWINPLMFFMLPFFSYQYEGIIPNLLL
jgi:hypothetical protein